MTPFSHPWVLILLVLPLAMMLQEWRGARIKVAFPFDHLLDRKSGGRGWTLLLRLLASAPACILALVILLLAGPKRLSDPQSKRSLTNIQFCLDVSGSMTSSFGEGDRYDAAMASINEFIDDRQGDAFGLTVFGDHFIHWVPLTDDTTALAHAPPFLNPKRLPRWFSQGTSIGKALRECRKLMIQREEGDRLIILLSDGYSFDLSNGEDERLARTFRDDRITVHAVHIGPGSPPDPLVNMTARTGGEVFAAGDPEGLSAVFRQIDAMQKTRMIKVSAETMDHFKPFAEAALYCMASVLLASFGLRYIPW